MENQWHFLKGWVSFAAPYPLFEMAEILSREVFAGIKFTGYNTGIWDECPAMKLEKDFLGMRFEFGGGHNEETGIHEYTLDMITLPVWRSKTPAGGIKYANIALAIREQLKRVPGIVDFVLIEKTQKLYDDNDRTDEAAS